MDYKTWVGGPWRVQTAEAETGMAKDDEITFELDAKDPSKIVLRFACTHSGAHEAKPFDGVVCHPSSSRARLPMTWQP
jgi:hypothetical protein